MDLIYSRIIQMNSGQMEKIISTFPQGVVERIKKKKNEKSILESVNAYLLLSKYLGKDNFKNANITSTTQRPTFVGNEKDFSISHTDGYVAILIGDADGTTLGVDIESKKLQKEDIKKLSNRFFFPEERKIVSSHRNNLSDFLSIWTTKEAIKKALPLNLELLSTIEATKPEKYGLKVRSFTLPNGCVISCAISHTKEFPLPKLDNLENYFKEIIEK